MVRTVQCIIIKREAEGLDKPPHPGELGLRIYESVSKEGWRRWLERLTIIINETGLSTVDPASISIIEQHMLGFLYGEGEFGEMPGGFGPRGGKK